MRATFNVLLHNVENIPSVQSLVATSNLPNICGAVMAFGFIRYSKCGSPVLVKDDKRQLIAAVLPDPVGPNIINPCRTMDVS